MINEKWSELAANAIAHEAQMTAAYMKDVVSLYERPSVMYRPRIFLDGDLWCSLYGDNLQDGVAGFGKSPALAMHDFDSNWRNPKP